MYKEALIYDNNVTYSNEQGNIKERENTAYIEEIMETENDIEIIKDKINDNKKDLHLLKMSKKDLLLYWLILTFWSSSMILLELFLVVPFSKTTGFLLQTSDIYYYLGWLDVELIGSSIILGKNIKYYKKIKNSYTLNRLLNKKLGQKEKELIEYKAKQKTLEFEKNKEKRLIDFAIAKEKYQRTLNKELNIEMYPNRKNAKAKVYAKH